MKFKEYLKEKQGSPLYGGAAPDDWVLTKYQHVERLGHEDVNGLLDGTVVVQEKLDGANFTVAKHPDRGLLMASRNNTIHVGGNPTKGFNGAIEYVLGHPGITTYLDRHPDHVLRGEWLVRHSINYAKERMGKFYVFDVQRGDGSYIPIADYNEELAMLEIPYLAVLAQLERPTIEQLSELTKGPGSFGAEQMEGIVVKRYDFVSRFGRTTWGKVVSADFKEANALTFGATKHDPTEIRFASLVTEEDVLKVIHKIKDVKGETSVRDMAQVLGRVWHDAFEDRLWDFLKKDGWPTIDFNQARRLVERFTRDTALAYYNGLTTSVATRVQRVERDAIDELNQDIADKIAEKMEEAA